MNLKIPPSIRVSGLEIAFDGKTLWKDVTWEAELGAKVVITVRDRIVADKP